MIVTPPSVTGAEGESLVFQISAIIPGTTDTEGAGLEVYVDNIPTGASFNRGRQEGDRWVFTPQDFGEVELRLPMGFTGSLEVNITAVVAGTRRQRSLIIEVQPIDMTTIITRDTPTAETTDDGMFSTT